MFSLTRAIPKAALVALALALAPPAHADPTVDVCLDAYERGQALRNSRRLAQARADFLVCAREACPRAIRKDCGEWLAEVDASMASVVVRVVDADGHEPTEAEVFVDAALVSNRLDGWAIPVEPGPRVIRVVLRGRPGLEQAVSLAQGEKNRRVVFDLGAPGQRVPVAPGTAAAVVPRRAPLLAYGAAGVGVLSLGAFAFLAMSGTRELNALHEECAVTRLCTRDDLDDVKRKLLVADVALATAVVAIGVSVILFIAHANAGPAPPGQLRLPTGLTF
jgi:hypothetical protein